MLLYSPNGSFNPYVTFIIIDSLDFPVTFFLDGSFFLCDTFCNYDSLSVFATIQFNGSLSLPVTILEYGSILLFSNLLIRLFAYPFIPVVFRSFHSAYSTS